MKSESSYCGRYKDRRFRDKVEEVLRENLQDRVLLEQS